MRINHNIGSLKIFNTYRKNLQSNSTALQRVSSGIKISCAKDNAAKIAHTEKNKFKVRSMDMASRNVQDGISMLQTNDSSLQQISDILLRMKELTVSAANGDKNYEDREKIQAELEQLKCSIDDLANNTEFNGVKLLGDKTVATNADPKIIKIAISDMAGIDIEIPVYNLESSALKDSNSKKLSDLSVLDENDAKNAVDAVDKIIDQINQIRGKYGALQNRLDTAYDNLNSNISKVEEANSKLTDSDVAAEVMEISRTDILTQTGIALIAQSNRLPQDALQVLQNVR